MNQLPNWDVIILAGGSSSRMGQDKSRAVLQSQTLLERTIDAVSSRARIIIVSGDQRPIHRNVIWSREDPTGSGPVAAIQAALSATESDWVMLLPCDLVNPAEAVERLLDALSENPVTGALLAQDSDARGGRIQWLTGLCRCRDLRGAFATLSSTDIPVRRLFEALDVSLVPPPNLRPDIWKDMDSPEDLARATKELS